MNAVIALGEAKRVINGEEGQPKQIEVAAAKPSQAATSPASQGTNKPPSKGNTAKRLDGHFGGTCKSGDKILKREFIFNEDDSVTVKTEGRPDLTWKQETIGGVIYIVGGGAGKGIKRPATIHTKDKITVSDGGDFEFLRQ